MKRLSCIFWICMVMGIFGTIEVNATTEIIVNGDFEDGINNWVCANQSASGTQASLELAVGMGVDGLDCAHITNTKNGRLHQTVLPLKNPTAGDKFTVTAMVKLDDPTKKVNVNDPAFIKLGGIFIGASNSNGTDWTEIKGTFTVNNVDTVAANSYFRLWISEKMVDYDCGYYIDNISVIAQQEPEMSEEEDVITSLDKANLFTNSGCEKLDGWYVGSTAKNLGAEVSIGEGEGTDDSNCVKLTGPYHAALRYKASELMGARKGDKIYISAKIKADDNLSASAGTVTMAYDGTGIGGWETLAQNFNIQEDWTLISGVYTLTKDVQGAVPLLEFRAATDAAIGNGNYYIDDVVIMTSAAVNLSDIQVAGLSVEDFNPEIFEYVVKVPYGTTIPPIVTASTGAYKVELGSSTYTVDSAVDMDDATEIIVKAPNGRTFAKYVIYFEEMESLGFSPIVFSGDFVPGGTVTATLPITNNSVSDITDVNVTLVIVIYDKDGAMVDFEAVTAREFEIDSLASRDLPVSITIDSNINVNGCKLGGFAIDSFQARNPMTGMTWK